MATVMEDVRAKPLAEARALNKMLIGGRWIDAIGGKGFDVFEPTAGKVIASAPEGGIADIDAAVAAARASFEDRRWTGLSAAARAKTLWRMGDLLDERAAELCALETLNNGMPLLLAGYTLAVAADTFRYFAGWCTKIHGITADVINDGGTFHAYTLREPVGVAGLITPWNAPISLAATKLAAALAAGCSCVLKPAEETPLTGLKLGQLLQEAGLPDGVVNVVTGYGHVAGAALTAHPDVDKISFTGSTEVGRLIIQAAAGNMKKVSLELGGKSPVIVCDDADLTAAVPGVAMGVFTNSGQVCMAGTRVYVASRLVDKFVDQLAQASSAMKVGDGFAPDTHLGPLISAKQRDRVMELIGAGVQDGARLVTGGKRVGDEGYFVEPTVLLGAPADSRVIREEIFGPVVAVTPFDDLGDAVRQANDTGYGLAAAVWTRDVARAHAVTRKLKAGTVWINTALALDVSVPFGGYKQSGWGREGGAEGLDSFLQSKSVFANIGTELLA